ncbi:MAG: 50S ribosomal protein L13 [Candidatus Zixiibacteriota bacterium]
MPKIDPNRRKWFIVDLNGATLGRTATKLVRILRGKHRPDFAPHVDCGDHIVAVNASGLKVSGKNKDENLIYYRYTGYPGGLRQKTFAQTMASKPEDALILAVRRMLPKTILGRKVIKKLHVYAGAVHPHGAQKPEPLK